MNVCPAERPRRRRRARFAGKARPVHALMMVQHHARRGRRDVAAHALETEQHVPPPRRVALIESRPPPCRRDRVDPQHPDVREHRAYSEVLDVSAPPTRRHTGTLLDQVAFELQAHQETQHADVGRMREQRVARAHDALDKHGCLRVIDEGVDQRPHDAREDVEIEVGPHIGANLVGADRRGPWRAYRARP